jgi:folate-binding protein YgfZ
LQKGRLARYPAAMAATTLTDRAVLRLAGEDVRGFLQGLVTADTALVAADVPAWAGLLTPQGKALFDFLLWAEGDDILVDCEAAEAEALARRLSLYRLRRKITIVRDLALGVHWAPEGSEGAPDPRLAALGRRWLAAPGEAAEGWRALRLLHGVTEGVAELGSDKTLWLEANAGELGGVSYTKGCYVGQENTARMHHRAKVNRRLIVAHAEADPGAAARVYYPDLGLAVAQVRVEALAPEMVLGEVAVRPVMPAWLAEALAEPAQ